MSENSCHPFGETPPTTPATEQWKERAMAAEELVRNLTEERDRMKVQRDEVKRRLDEYEQGYVS